MTVPYSQLMEKAWEHAREHGAMVRPVLSPLDTAVLNREVPVRDLHAAGFRVVPWTTNKAQNMRSLIRMGVDGIISDRPDILQQILKEERAEVRTEAQRMALANFEVAGHRGGRGLRPENTLPAFEWGLDQLVTTIEADTGVTSDGVSLIWHDQFLEPESCRKADGAAYTLENRIYVEDISSVGAQETFVCDKTPFGPDQSNDPALSPAALAFAESERLISPYVPTYVEQLFRFVSFYADFYRKGTGKGHAHAKERSANADRLKFKLEMKILPNEVPPDVAGEHTQPRELAANRSVGPQKFVDSLCGAIARSRMESRAQVQSFDFRTLFLVQEQYSNISTCYLTTAAIRSALNSFPDRCAREFQTNKAL